MYRGDIDELSRDKPKKPIQIGIGGGRDDEPTLTMTATVDEPIDVGTSFVPFQGEDDMSSGFTLTASVDDVSSSTFDVGNASGLFPTTVDVSSTGFTLDQDTSSSAGFTLSATVDDITSSNIMVDSITAELGDTSSTSNIIQSKSPNRLTPNPPQGKSPTPKSFSPVSFSPKPGASPTSQLKKSASPRSPVAPATVSSMPSKVSNSTSSTTSFDNDRQTRQEVTREQHVQERPNGYDVTVVQKTTVSATSSAPIPKKPTAFVKSQKSAFDAPQKSPPAVVNGSVGMKKGPEPFKTTQRQAQPQMDYKAATLPRVKQGPAPMFKPSKFVPGQGKRDIPGLYTPASPQIEVNIHAMYEDGKENMQPLPPRFQVRSSKRMIVLVIMIRIKVLKERFMMMLIMMNITIFIVINAVLILKAMLNLMMVKKIMMMDRMGSN